MSLVLDAGALVAIERGDVTVMTRVKEDLLANLVPSTHGGVVAQVWRGGRGRQARLARFLPNVRVEPLDEELGKRAGVLVGKARTADVVDAAVVLLATDGDVILTSDPEDLLHLAETAGLDVEIVAV